MQQTVYSVIALDIGEVRTGVAIARSVARIASPLVTLATQDNLTDAVKKLVREHDVRTVVVGLPRNLQGQSTAQTTFSESIAAKIEEVTGLPIHFMDEAGTSQKAEAELKARKKPYEKQDIDMLAATYILEDFMSVHPEVFADVS